MIRWRCQKGFTLLDVMQASVLSTIALVGISSLLMATVHTNLRGRDITAAATLGQAKIEELRVIPVGSLTSGSDTVADAEIPYARTWTISVGPTASTVAVRVLVEWEGQGGHGVDLETILYN
jgi:Tfp pilus assembly protein PilV